MNARRAAAAAGMLGLALPEGYRLENWGATCAVEEHDAVRCETYNNHGFTLSADHGELW